MVKQHRLLFDAENSLVWKAKRIDNAQVGRVTLLIQDERRRQTLFLPLSVLALGLIRLTLFFALTCTACYCVDAITLVNIACLTPYR